MKWLSLYHASMCLINKQQSRVSTAWSDAVSRSLFGIGRVQINWSDDATAHKLKGDARALSVQPASD
jgi:hypothetical protein